MEGIQTSPQMKFDSVCFLKTTAPQCRCNYSTDIYYCGVCLNVPTCFSSATSISPSLSSFHKIYSTGRAQRRLLISLKSSCLTPQVETAHGGEREGKMHTKSEIIIFALQKCKTKGNRLAGGKQIEFYCRHLCLGVTETNGEKKELSVQAVLINQHIPDSFCITL